MIGVLRSIGAAVISRLRVIGRASLLLAQLSRRLPAAGRRARLVLEQIFSLGVLSLIIIVVSGLFVGMVLGLQGYRTLEDFGAEDSLGVLVSLSLIRELGPVVAALLFAGRAGSALTAEIGLMKATDQLAALEMMAVDPVEYIMLPRWVAGVFAMPLLAALFSAVGIFGGYLVGVLLLGVDGGAYWSQMQDHADLTDDVMNGVIKSLVFGALVTWIAIFQGADCSPTAEGVGRAATRTVVISSLVILAADFLLTALMFGGV